MREKTFLLTTDDKIDMFVYQWLPDGKRDPETVVQIAHGMGEHAGRYRELANFLTDKGLGVYANDHRGHGKTAGSPEKVGFFAEKNGWDLVVEDMNRLTKRIKSDFPEADIFLLGHSMGSLLSRDYMSRFGDEVKGVLLSGTASDPGMLGNVGIIIAKVSGMLFGKRSKSPLLDKLSFGAFNGKFKPNRTKFDWLSRDEKMVDGYVNDEYCGAVFTAGFFSDLLSGVKKIHKKANVRKIPSGLPVLIVSGNEDPVGKNGKGVRKVAELFKKNGMNNVNLKLYPGARHEILNEINRQEVFTDILSWIRKQRKA